MLFGSFLLASSEEMQRSEGFGRKSRGQLQRAMATLLVSEESEWVEAPLCVSAPGGISFYLFFKLFSVQKALRRSRATRPPACSRP